MANKTPQMSVDRVFSGWRGVVLAIFIAFIGLKSVTASIDRVRVLGAFGTENSGTRGFRFVADPARPGWHIVAHIYPKGTAEVAGIVEGDRLRFDQPWMVWREFRAGEVVSLAVEHQDRSRHVDLVIRPLEPTQLEPGNYAARIIETLAGLADIVIGFIVLWRGWGRMPAMLLGLGLVPSGAYVVIPFWISSDGAAMAWMALSVIALGLAPCTPLMSFALYRELVSPMTSRRWLWVIGGLLAVYLACACAMGVFLMGAVAFDPSATLNAVGGVGVLFGAYWAWRGLRDGRAERERFRGILLAYVLLGIGLVMRGVLAAAFNRRIVSIDDPLVMCAYLLWASFPFIVAWSVLRHKVVDLGFAINRTLVYGVVSAILLASFGVFEWAAHHLLPEDWGRASAWVDGGIALALFLVFHRVRDFVEHRIEHLFFHAWYDNEAKLRRFVASAGHFESRETLISGFTAELTRFTGGAVAVYIAQDTAFVRVAGGWEAAPERYTSDDPAFALMRTERRPLDLTELVTAVPGVLALPMLDHGTLTGMALIGPKADGSLYRPDEVECVGWAAMQVGLDLAALRARQLEREVQRLSAQVDKLSEVLASRTAVA